MDNTEDLSSDSASTLVSNENKNIILHLENNKELINSNKERRLLVRNTSSRPIQKWTSEEVDALKKGIEKFGKGNWIKINNYYTCLRNRTPTSLKDKYRLIRKNTSYYLINSRKWYELLPNDAIRLDVQGTPVYYRTRFPYDAATMFCTYRRKEENTTFNICIIDTEKYEQGTIKHFYAVNVIDNKFIVRKMFIG